MWGLDPASGVPPLAFLVIIAVGAFIAVRICEMLEPRRLWSCDEEPEIVPEPEIGHTAGSGAP